MDPPAFSVLFPVHGSDTAPSVRRALESLTRQTLEPTEIVVVADRTAGGDLRAVISSIDSSSPVAFDVLALESEVQLGPALAAGVARCRHEFVARMDADDVAVPDRFEVQIRELRENEDLAVLGGAVGEFDGTPDEVVRHRRPPTTHGDIARYARHRNPMNHPTVAFRRSAVLDAGNYRNFPGFEDYELWLRMLHGGHRMRNLGRTLVKAEAGPDLFDRRSGLDYLVNEVRTHYEFLDRGYITAPDFAVNVAVRAPLRLLPVAVSKRIYGSWLRSS